MATTLASPLIKDIIGHDGFYAVLSEVRDDLPPVVGGVIAYMKEYFLDGILKFSTAGGTVLDALAQVRIGDNLHGAQMVGLVIGLAGFEGVELIHLQCFFSHYSGIPDLVGVDHM